MDMKWFNIGYQDILLLIKVLSDMLTERFGKIKSKPTGAIVKEMSFWYF